jgi:hypothetical protein
VAEDKTLTIEGTVAATNPARWPCYIDPNTMFWYKEGCVPEDATGTYKIFLDDLTESGSNFKDDMFTYTRSGTDPNYLYTRTSQKLFFPPGIGGADRIQTTTWYDIKGDTIEDGLIYISTSSDPTYKGLYAMVIYCMQTGTSDYGLWSWDNTDAIWRYANKYGIINGVKARMEGGESSGYYVTEDQYYSQKHVEDATNAGVITFYSGIARALYNAHCTDENMVGYDPYNWKYVNELVEDFDPKAVKNMPVTTCAIM